MNDKTARWLWYPGDFELYHALKQNFSRVERGFGWPAFWKSAGFRQRVTFLGRFAPEADTVFTVHAVQTAVGYVQLNGKKYPFETAIPCPKGEAELKIHIGCIACVPAVFVEGEAVRSDASWRVHDYETPPVPAGWSPWFTDPGRDPADWAWSERAYEPVSQEAVNGGTLCTFETELTAALELTPTAGKPYPAVVYLGESRPEALDTVNCYYFCTPDPATGRCPRAALRCAFLPDVQPEDFRVRAIHQFLDIPVRASFRCDDRELNRIFDVAAHTFRLCSQVFFLDGIKRDRWIWSGDAYQSLLINRYLTADPEIERRTLVALRGNDPVTTHINTILDYSLLWVLSVYEHVQSYGDGDFVTALRPKLSSLLDLCLAQREEHGFLVGREQDWVFIDWADFDREGPLCAEQMLLYRCCRVMAALAEPEQAPRYQAEADRLLAQIDRCFWDEAQGAYVDSFTSGKRQVTRHANIFAVLFDVAGEARKRRILETVLQNDAVPAITTPYFRFFELEALCRLGCLETVLGEIKAYWGGMLRLGAVTFWEEYDPKKPLEQQYAMYGDPYGKSLCHAWAASPIYLLARYFLGLEPGNPRPRPRTEFFQSLDCTFPLGDRQITVTLRDGKVAVQTEPWRPL